MRGVDAVNSLKGVFLSFWLHRDLILQMSRREIVGRYKASVLGILWSLVIPVLMLAVYTFVFSIVFKAKWGNTGGSRTEFAIVLFCGLIVYNLFAECLSRSPTLILSNVSYVKKVVFPLETLPWISMVSSLFHTAIGFLVLLGFYLLVNFTLNWTIVILPLVLFPLVLMTMGVCWFMASLGVFLRDIGQVIGVIVTILLFMSPIFYPVSAVPADLRLVLHLNPLSFYIEQSRRVLLWGQMPEWNMLVVYFLIGLATAALGLFWFQKTKKGFADVL